MEIGAETLLVVSDFLGITRCTLRGGSNDRAFENDRGPVIRAGAVEDDREIACPSPGLRGEILLRLCRGVDPVERIRKLSFAGVAPEADTDRGTCLPISESKRAEDVARPTGAAGAGASKGESEIAKIRY